MTKKEKQLLNRFFDFYLHLAEITKKKKVIAYLNYGTYLLIVSLLKKKMKGGFAYSTTPQKKMPNKTQLIQIGKIKILIVLSDEGGISWEAFADTKDTTDYSKTIPV